MSEANNHTYPAVDLREAETSVSVIDRGMLLIQADNDAVCDTSLSTVLRRLEARRIQAALGQELRLAFDDVANAPIPDRFIALLKALEEKERDK